MGITAIKLVSQKLLINKTSLNTLLLCIAKLRLVGFFYRFQCIMTKLDQ